MQVAPSVSTYAPAPGDLGNPPAGDSAYNNSYTELPQDNASTSLFAPADNHPPSDTLGLMTQAQTKPLLVTPENAAGPNPLPPADNTAPASATTPTASPTEIAALELLLAEPANQDIIAQYGPPLRPLNTDTNVGQGILARFGPDLGARLTQLQEAQDGVRNEYLHALDQATQNPGPGTPGSQWVPGTGQGETAEPGRWTLDPAAFSQHYAQGDSLAQRAFADMHGQDPLVFHEGWEGDAHSEPSYHTLGPFRLAQGQPYGSDKSLPDACLLRDYTQLSPEHSADLINKEYLWFDPVNGWSTSADNIQAPTGFLDKALPVAFSALMCMVALPPVGTLLSQAGAGTFVQGAAMGAMGSAISQTVMTGGIDFGNLLRSALTGGIAGSVMQISGMGEMLKSADLGTRGLAHLGKAGLTGLLQEATGGKFKDGFMNSALASIAAEVGAQLDHQIGELQDVSPEQASVLKLMSKAASSALRIAGTNDPAAGFAGEFLSGVLGDGLQGAQGKGQEQSQVGNEGQAQDKPSSDWVRNLGASEVDAQGLRPGLGGQGLQISGETLSNWSDEVDGGIALNSSMAPGAQAITEAVVGQGQGPLAALAAAGLDRQQQIAAYGQLVASGQVQLNAQGIPIVQPGQVLRVDLSDMSAAQLGGRAIAQESAGRAQREQQLAAQQAAETAHTTQENQERWDQMRMAWGGRTGTQGPVWHVGGSAQAQPTAAQASNNAISQAEAQSIAVAMAGGFAPLDSSLSPDIASGVGSPLMVSSAGATAGVAVSLGKAALGTARMLSDNVNVALDIATGGVFHNTPLMQQSWANNAAVGGAMINAISSPRETATDVMESIGNRFSAATAITDNDFQRSYALGELAADVAQAGVGGVFGVRSLARLGASEMRSMGLQDYAIRPGALPEGLARNSQAGAIGLPELVAVDANGGPLAGVGNVANRGGNTFPDGLAYRLDLPEHLAGPDGFTKSGQLSGTHNLNTATAALDAKGATYTLTPTGTSGISELSYSYVKPNSGKIITGNKTVYDPAVFSDQTMLDHSLTAGQKGWTRYLIDPNTTAFDVTSGGVNFRAYINFDGSGNPYVGNIHPIK